MMYFFVLKFRVIENEGKRQNASDLPPAGSLPTRLQRASPGPGQSTSQEVYLGLQHGARAQTPGPSCAA